MLHCAALPTDSFLIVAASLNVCQTQQTDYSPFTSFYCVLITGALGSQTVCILALWLKHTIYQDVLNMLMSQDHDMETEVKHKCS